MSPRIELFVGTFSWLFIVALIAATIAAKPAQGHDHQLYSRAHNSSRADETTGGNGCAIVLIARVSWQGMLPPDGP